MRSMGCAGDVFCGAGMHAATLKALPSKKADKSLMIGPMFMYQT